MERLTLQVGGFEVNCSILSENGKAWIVDPGQEAERLVATLEKKGLEPTAILLTHGHFDHIGGIPGLLERFPGLPVYLHPFDIRMIGHPLNQLPPEYPPVAKMDCRDIRTCEGPAGMRVIETPGHTPGGVCCYFPDDALLLSGDTLFAGSVGRTDLPGGDMATLMRSLKRLTELPGDTLVIPGHGPQTTIAAENEGNPFLRIRGWRTDCS